MPVTLAQASLNAADDIDTAVIDEFRKESTLLDTLVFDDVVNPAGGGATLTYGYTRLTSQATADFRAINSEYVPAEVTKARETVDLKVLGGSYQIDRVLAGVARGAEVALQANQKIKATKTRFADETINGDVAVDADGFDGLDQILTGSSTEMNANEVSDWSDLDAAGTAHGALDLLDEFLALMDGAPTLVMAHRSALAKIRGVARRSGQYVREPVEGLVGQGGRPVVRETYGGVLFVDLGEKAGSTDPIIPIEDRTVATVAQTGLTDIYAVRIGLDGFHGVTTVGSQLIRQWLPDFDRAGAVKTGEVEMGPVAIALKATKAAAVLRNVKVR